MIFYIVTLCLFLTALLNSRVKLESKVYIKLKHYCYNILKEKGNIVICMAVWCYKFLLFNTVMQGPIEGKVD